MSSKPIAAARALVVACFLPVAAVSHGESLSARYSGPNWSLVEAAAVRATAAGITAEKLPDCDEATVEKRMVRVYRPDGTGEAQDETYTKILTERGRRDNRTLSYGFMLPYSTVEVVSLEIVHPDGTVVPVDVAANSKESIDDSQMQMNIYDPNSRVLRVGIPKVDIGDLVHSVVRSTTERAIIPGHFAEGNVLEGRGFIHHVSYEVHAPAARPLAHIALRDPVPGTVKAAARTNADGSIVHRWEASGVPRMFDEPGMPPYEMVLQRLLVSTLPDWETVSRWYWDLSAPHLSAPTPEMRGTVASLTAGAKDDDAKIRALYHHVASEVRYMGLTPEKDRPGFEPHDVGITFAKKYGVCRDKAALLVAMLREAGIKAYPVLINVGTHLDPEVPDPSFNHAIVAAEPRPGKYLLMDPTDETSRELLPTSDGNQSHLVCRPEGSKLAVSPVEPADHHLLRVKTEGTLRADGTLEARSAMTFDGVNDDAYRQMFARLKPDEARRFFERNLKQAMPAARLLALSLTPTNMLDTAEPVRVELAFAAEGLVAAGDGKAIVAVPWISKGLGVASFILDGAGLDRRKYPLQTSVACGLEEDLSLRLDDGFLAPVSLPAEAPIADAGIDYAQRVAVEKGTLHATRRLLLKTVEFSPAQYSGLKAMLRDLEFDARKAPVIAVAKSPAPARRNPAADRADAAVESDAEILESRKELDVADAHSAVLHARYSKRILTYNGKTREAELKIPFNPAHRDVRLVRAVVTFATGAKQEIAPGEINVMDDTWNASAKRYTGGKILVANLPGVDIGSTVDVEYELRIRDEPLICGSEAFQLGDRLGRKTFRLSTPAGLPASTRVTGARTNLAAVENRVGDRIESTWSAENVAPLGSESQLPPDWIYRSGVAYCLGDPKVYYAELNRVLVDRSRQSARAAATARELVAKATNRLDAVRMVRDFVARSIRAAGPSFDDLPWSELSAADTTLADGYGHAADRAILLHAMLVAGGFRPEFVLASELPAVHGIDDDASGFPMPDSYRSPLVRVTVDGVQYHLNDTDQYARLGATGHDGRMAIVLAKQKRDVVRAAAACRERVETEYHVALADDGGARMRVVVKYFGLGHGARNRYFAELPPEERRRYFQEVVSGMSQGARADGELTTDFSGYPGREEFSVAIDRFGVADGSRLYFALPSVPSLFASGTDDRKLPMLLPRGGESIVRTEIELPPGYRRVAIVPRGGTVEAPGGTAKTSVKSAPGKCVVTQELRTRPALVSPAEYPAMLRAEATLRGLSARMFLLERSEAGRGK